MKAMILAAGRGERLKPLTLRRAKPAIPVFNVPMIARTLNFLSKYGIDEAVINLHYLPDSVKKAVEEEYKGNVKIVFSREKNLLGTAGGLKNVEKHFRDETFVMINSDTLLDFDLKEMIGFHIAERAFATMLLSHPEGADNFGKVSLANDGRVVDILGALNSVTPSVAVNFTGVHIFEPDILDFIRAGKVSEINSDIYPDAIKKGNRIMGFVNRGVWHDIGTLDRYRKIQTGQYNETMKALRIQRDEKGNIISNENTFVDEKAEVLYSVIGKGCKIEKGCRVINSVILDNVTLCENTIVENTVIDNVQSNPE